MDITIQPNKLQGLIEIIPSKSQAHRYLICAALADGPTAIGCTETSRDMDATADCLRALGADITRTDWGYRVTPIRLSGIYERISEGREEGVCHKIYFIFLCKLDGPDRAEPIETDRFQIGLEWIDIREIQRRNLFPRAIRDNISGLIGYGETIFIGSEKDR